jgi:hypothetical protein
MSNTKRLSSEQVNYSNAFVLASGKTYEHRERLNQLGFKLDYDNKIWFRSILKDKFWVWEELIKPLVGVDISLASNLIEGILLVKEFEQMRKECTTPEPIEHELTDKILEVSKWYAVKFKENNNSEYIFRNLKVLNVYIETRKAYLIDAEFYGGITSTCGCCGRELINEISRATGIGPVCATKIGLPRPKIETAQETVKLLHEKSKQQGIFKQVWIPKSQIKGISTD